MLIDGVNVNIDPTMTTLLGENAQAIVEELDAKAEATIDDLFAEGMRIDQLEQDTLDLELDAWKQCLGKGAHRGRIREDAALARKVRALGTPHTFVNGRKVAGVRSVNWFSTLVDAELAKARALMASGTLRRDVYTQTIAAGSAALED